MKRTKKGKLFVVDIILFVALVAADQFIKHLAVLHLKNQQPVVIWKNVFELNYLENRGAAFGMLQNQKLFFIFVAIVILGAIIFVLVKMPNERKYTIIHVLLVCIAAGAVGNLVDRLRLDYVVDFFYFVLINFPVFNVADMYVSIATFILAIEILFVLKEEDFNFLSFKMKTYYREVKTVEAEAAFEKKEDAPVKQDEGE